MAAFDQGWDCCKGVSEGSPVLRFPFVRLLVFVTNDEDYV